MRRYLAWLGAFGALAVTALPVPAHAAPSYAPINGSGSTWSANALSQWAVDVASAGMSVSYAANGSSAGRRDFAQQLTDFGVSEIPYQGVDPATGQGDTANGRPYAYMPIVAGGTAFMYHLTVGGKLYRDLRLSGDTITKIFTGKIKNWSDPAITRDNNGKKLPNKRIIPVVRSDGSGTTAQFTLWMSKRHRAVWCAFYAKCGLTSYYPSFGNSVAQSGSMQMAAYISASYGEGTIGYVEYSYARNANYPVAKVRNAANYYVEPTDYNVAVALTKARINQNKASQDYLTQILDGVWTHTDPRTYPLSSYSYMVLPTSLDRRITKEKGRSLGAFSHYFLCQGQQKAGALGFSPLPLNLVKAGFEQVAKVPGAEASKLRPEGCNNPTFDPGNPGSNRLARIAPQPPACDKDGAGPCSGGGTTKTTGGGPKFPTGGGPTTGGQTSTGGGPQGQPKMDPVTGQTVTGNGDAAGTVATAAQGGLGEGGLTSMLGVLAAGEILLLMLGPVLLARYLHHRRQLPSGAPAVDRKGEQ